MLEELHDDKILFETTLSIKLPRYLKDDFRYAVKNNLNESTTVHEVLTKYIIKYIGDYNKACRS